MAGLAVASPCAISCSVASVMNDSVSSAKMSACTIPTKTSNPRKTDGIRNGTSVAMIASRISPARMLPKRRRASATARDTCPMISINNPGQMNSLA